MRSEKILKNTAIVFIVICVTLLAIEMFKALKINFNFMGMQSSTRVSSSSDAHEVRYEPTDYAITNKDEVLEEVKNITTALKNEYVNSGNKENLFEIGNIHKIENFFYEYEKYAVVKYKLLNIAEDLHKLYKATKGYTDTQLTSYFDNNKAYIENLYGITTSSTFNDLAKSLSFLEDSEVNMLIVKDETIDFDIDNDVLTFSVKVKSESNKSEFYFVKVDYYKTSDNQVTPYVNFRLQ